MLFYACQLGLHSYRESYAAAPYGKNQQLRRQKNPSIHVSSSNIQFSWLIHFSLFIYFLTIDKIFKYFKDETGAWISPNTAFNTRSTNDQSSLKNKLEGLEHAQLRESPSLPLWVKTWFCSIFCFLFFKSSKH